MSRKSNGSTQRNSSKDLTIFLLRVLAIYRLTLHLFVTVSFQSSAKVIIFVCCYIAEGNKYVSKFRRNYFFFRLMLKCFNAENLVFVK